MRAAAKNGRRVTEEIQDTQKERALIMLPLPIFRRCHDEVATKATLTPSISLLRDTNWGPNCG